MNDAISDADLLAKVVRASGNRLKTPLIVHSGRRFLLARALHGPSNRLVLLTISKPYFAEGQAQVAKITELFNVVRDPGLGVLLDRFWSLPSEADSWWCTATSWHADCVRLDEALVRSEFRWNIVEALREVTAQLKAIHDAGFVHGDVSAGNILVGLAGVHLVDLEYVTDSRFLTSDAPFLTFSYSHPQRIDALARAQYSLDEAQAWDRYALGQVFLQALADADPYHHDELDLYTQRALRLIGCLLLDGANASTEIALGLQVEFFHAEKYTHLEQALGAIDRLLGRSSLEVSVPELSAVPAEVVEVRLDQPAPFTRRVRALVKTPEMRQIGSSLQLGLIALVWPTATHTRLEHALGTFGTMRVAIINMFADPQSPIFRVLGTPNIVKILLASALLHDVGHFPLAHDLEEAYSPPFKHEARSIRLIMGPAISAILGASEKDAEQPGWAIDPRDVASVVKGVPLEGSGLSAWVCGLLHSMLSGALDVDKLDYLVRDSNALGVAAGGGIDVARVLSSLTVAVVPGVRNERHLRLAVRAKGVRPAELVGRIRSHMFGVAYWHRSYRSIKAMMHWMVWESMLLTGSAPVSMRRSAGALAGELFGELDGGKAELDTFRWNPQGLGTIPQREAEVLALINNFGAGADASDSFGKRSRGEMFRLLRGHEWFRAVLTIDHYDNVAISDPESAVEIKRLWRKLDKLIAPGPRRGREDVILTKMALSRSVQARIVAILNDAPVAITKILDPLATLDRITRESLEKQLFLVDFVESGKSKETPLYFLEGERPGSRLTDTSRAIPVRRSFDQHQLASEFLVSNGAIRLFCHPDFSRFIEGTLSAEVMREVLIACTDELLVN